MSNPTYLRRQLTKSKAAEARANDHVDNLLDTNRNQAVDIRVLRNALAARDKSLDAIRKAVTARQRRIRDLIYTALCVTAIGLVLLSFGLLIPAHRGTVPDYAVTIPFILGASAMMLLIVFEPDRKKGKRKRKCTKASIKT